MTLQTARFQTVTTAMAVAVVVLSLSSPIFAQRPIQDAVPTVRTTISGRAFLPEGPAGHVSVDDVAGGRRFRGEAHKLVVLRGPIQIPTWAEPRLLKLIIRFRSSQGPRLFSVELRSGSNISIHRATDIKGDYGMREVLKPDTAANAWVFQRINVGAPLVARLSVQYSGGFEGGDPGEFVLTEVVAEFPRKPLGTLETTTTAVRPRLSH
jgi:hypothetical protein